MFILLHIKRHLFIHFCCLFLKWSKSLQCIIKLIVRKKNDYFALKKNNVISPNFLVCKFCGKAQFSNSFGRIGQRKYGEISAFYAVLKTNSKSLFVSRLQNILKTLLDLNIISSLFSLIMFRSSHPEVFLGKGVLQICSKFTGEHPCQSVISIE